MNELEKVISGLACCTQTMLNQNTRPCDGCPYDVDGKAIACNTQLMADALELLKTQEPVKPIMHYVPDGKRSSTAWQCGNCLIDIGYGENYCHNCRRKVKWNA